MTDNLNNEQQEQEIVSDNDPHSEISRDNLIAAIGLGSLSSYKSPSLRCALGCGILSMPQSKLMEELWQVRNALRLQSNTALLELIDPLFQQFHFDSHYENLSSERRSDSFELLELGVKLINSFNSLKLYGEVELCGLILELEKVTDSLFFSFIDKDNFRQNLPSLTIEEYYKASDYSFLRPNDIYMCESSDNLKALFTAIQNGDIQRAASLLESGTDVNQRWAYGNLGWTYEETPLYAAVQNGDIAMVELLTKNGADVNVELYLRNTPLMIASERRDSEMVKLLFASGANVNYDMYDWLLEVVATANEPFMLELFIKNCVERDSKIAGKENCLDVLAQFEQFATAIELFNTESGQLSEPYSNVNEENNLLGANTTATEIV